MVRLVTVLSWVVLAAGCVLYAQEGQQGPQGLSPRPLNVKPPPVPKARVTGRVLCGDTRQPARGAAVMLLPLAGTTQRTAGGLMTVRVGLDGQFVLEHVASGTYGVLAFLPGYLSPVDDVSATPGPSGKQAAEAELIERLQADAVHVGEDGTVARDVVLDRGASVSGRVQYADGAPAMQVNIDVQREDAPAQAEGPDGAALLRGMMLHQSVSTDDRGSFRVSGIAPGRYRVAAVPPADSTGFAFEGIDVGNHDGLHYYSGDTLHRKAAKVFELQAGDEVGGIEIRLPLDGLHTVRGRLTDKAGQPVGVATVSLSDTTDAALIFHAHVDADGSFQMKEVPPGSYRLATSNAMQAGLADNAFRQMKDGSTAVIVLDKDPDGIVLALDWSPAPQQPPPGLPKNGIQDNPHADEE